MYLNGEIYPQDACSNDFIREQFVKMQQLGLLKMRITAASCFIEDDYKAEDFKNYASALDTEGFSIHVHSVGGRATRVAIHALEAARQRNGDRHIPHSINDLLYNKNSYTWRAVYPVQSSYKACAVLVAGSDAPVDSCDPRPFINIAAGICAERRDQVARWKCAWPLPACLARYSAWSARPSTSLNSESS